MHLIRLLVIATFVFRAPLAHAKTYDLVIYVGVSADVIASVQSLMGDLFTNSAFRAALIRKPQLGERY